MSSDSIFAALDLNSEITALCLEERPQLFTLAAVDHDTHDGGVVGWVLAWHDRVVVYWEGRRFVSTFPSLPEFWKHARKHERSDDLRVIPMDGQPVPHLG